MQKQRVVGWVKEVLRWSVAVLGIWYVLSRMTWHDHVLVIPPGQNAPASFALVQAASETDDSFQILDHGQVVTVPRDQTINEPDRPNLQVVDPSGKSWHLLGLDLSPDFTQVRRLLVSSDHSPAHWETPDRFPAYHLNVPHPRVQIGILTMVSGASRNDRWIYLLAALAIFPVTILITSIRWHELLKPLDVHVPLSRIFVLNMVGLFSNTFIPAGSTGGDLVKAYYVARQTHHRTRAVMSVIIDRIVGLLALIILGGSMAAMQSDNRQCRQVAIGSGAILLITAITTLLLFFPRLRKMSGLAAILSRLPMQKRIHSALVTLDIYGRHMGLLVLMLLFSIPVHMTVIMSAQLCGKAFALPITPFYYWMAVPVIVLAGAIPISPQGAGVMEFFAIKLLEPQGVSVAQAFALTMSIRLVQIFWNLSGGYFVLRGGYHAPTASEQEQADREDQDNDPDPAGQTLTAR